MRDTIDMAREAGFTSGELAFMQDNFLFFARLVRADEREACAQIADLAEPYQAADLIRARSGGQK
jgi:hypothetical protein